MIIYLKSKDNYTLIDTDYLGKYKYGGEGRVYNYNDLALKIHWNNLKAKEYLNEKMVEIFKQIKTNRILMPQNTLYTKNSKNNYKYAGYTTKYIHGINDFSEIGSINSSKLLDELELIYEDCDILSENNIALYDLKYEQNILYNGNIYFVDPGKFLISNCEDLEEINIKNLNAALFFHIFKLQENFEYLKQNTRDVINEYLGDFNDYLYNYVAHTINKIYNLEYSKAMKRYNTYYDYLLDVIYKYDDLNKYKSKLIKDTIDGKNNRINEKQMKLLKRIID